MERASCFNALNESLVAAIAVMAAKLAWPGCVEAGCGLAGLLCSLQ